MAVAGIDMGSQSTKVVILEGERILAAVVLRTGESGETESRQALEEALRRAHLALDDLQDVVATGAGRMNAPFARQQRSTMSCLARAAHFLYPQARTIVDAGAESSTAIRLSADGTVADMTGNDKCAGGSGTFLDNMSQMLRIPLAEMGPLSLGAASVEPLSAKCAVFAESEVISLVHRAPAVPIANIVAGIHESMVDRLFALAQRVGLQPELVMTGGVSKNSGVVRAMEARLGRPVLVPDDPQIVGALGAALAARQGVARSGGERMNTLKRTIAAAWWVLGALALWTAAPVDALAQAPAVDPAAVQKLKQATDFLAGLPRFSVKTDNVIEELQFSGHRVDHDVSNSVTIQRPDKMRAARAGGLMDQRLFYDGKSMTLYNPNEKVYATEPAPDTIEKMIELAREKIGILLPAADLLYRNAFPLMMQDVTLAVVVGKSVVGGVVCDHLLFSRPGVDFQLWIADGDKPWPRKYVVTETGTPERLSITTLLSDWDTAPAVDDALFRFVPPKGTQAIEFLPLESTGGSDR